MTQGGDTDEADTIFDKALAAAGDAFEATIDAHFGRTFDGSDADLAGLMEEYRASARELRQGARLVLRTGLIDADFVCWHSDFADRNFADEARQGRVSMT